MTLTRLLTLRNLSQSRARAVLSALAVALGVAMTVAADVSSQSIINALSASEDAMTLGGGLIDQLDQMLVSVGAGITFAAGFMVFNAFAMTITQRRQQIGALRSLGMTRGQIMRLTLSEAALTGAAGTVAGLLAGPLLGRLTIALMKALLKDIFVFTDSVPSTGALLLAAGLGMAVTLLSVLIPAWRAAQVSPMAALRNQTPSGADRPPAGRTWVSLSVAAGLAVYVAAAPPGEWIMPPWDVRLALIFVLVWLACLAIAAPGLIGAMGRVLAGPMTRLWGAGGRLTADNLRRARGRVTVTTLTLAASLAMIVALTGFINLAMKEFMMPKVYQSIDLGAYIMTRFDMMAGMEGYVSVDSIKLPPEAVADLKELAQGRARVMEWHFVVVPELSFLGDSYFSFVGDPHHIQQAGDTFFTFIEGDWETAIPIMEAGCGVLTTPLVAHNNGVGLGDGFTVTGASGPVECTLAGIGATYVSSSFISLTAAEAFEVDDPLSVLFWPLIGEDIPTLEADLDALVERRGDIEYRPMEDMAELQTKAIDYLPALFNAPLLLAILASALGVVNTTVMSVAERRRELGLLRAVGATRRQVMGIVAGEAALMGLAGAFLGVLTGAGISVIITVTYGGASWGFPDLDLWGAAWRSVRPALVNGLFGLLVSPLICAAAAWLPARGLLREGVIDTIRES